MTGASGLIGAALVDNLRADGHEVVRLVRRPARGRDERQWDPAAGTIADGALDEADAVVHLAGVGIGDHRWSEEHKAEVLASRVDGTRTVAEAVAATGRPMTLLSASAVGWYGDTGDEVTDESGAPGTGFLADVVRQWEASAGPAVEAGARVVFLRSGVVLSPDGGALGKVLPLFRLGLGGRLGSGRQWMSWIAMPDQLAAIRFLLEHDEVTGPVNLTAPEPARNRDYTRTVGRAVRRPALAVVPRTALRVALGGFADEGVLVSQRVVPTRLEQAGFTFTYDDVDAAVAALVD